MHRVEFGATFDLQLKEMNKKVAGTFHVPSATPKQIVLGYGTWSVPATLRCEISFESSWLPNGTLSVSGTTQAVR